MQAYQELNDLLCLVNQRMDIILDDKKGKEIFSWCLRNKESFSDVIEKVEIVHTYIIWFSNDMRKILLDYLAFLCIIYNYVVDEKAGEKYFKKLLENYGLNIDMVKKQKEYFCSKNNFNGELDEDLLAIGLVISDTLLKETNDLMCKLNNDMETLHDIDKFFKEKAPK